FEDRPDLRDRGIRLVEVEESGHAESLARSRGTGGRLSRDPSCGWAEPTGRRHRQRRPRRSGEAQRTDLTIRRRATNPPALRPTRRARNGKPTVSSRSIASVEVSGRAVPLAPPVAAASLPPDPLPPDVPTPPAVPTPTPPPPAPALGAPEPVPA